MSPFKRQRRAINSQDQEDFRKTEVTPGGRQLTALLFLCHSISHMGRNYCFVKTCHSSIAAKSLLGHVSQQLAEVRKLAQDLRIQRPAAADFCGPHVADYLRFSFLEPERGKLELHVAPDL